MIGKILRKFIPNAVIENIKSRVGVPSQSDSFERLKYLGFNPKHIIDIGAYHGDWSAQMQTIFPQARFMLIEGQLEKEKIIQKKMARLNQPILHIGVLGAEEKDVVFNKYETASSVYTEDNYTGAEKEKVKLQLLDKIVANTPFEKCDLIKLDVQGYELEVLKGGLKTLREAQAVLMEVSFLNIYNGSPLASDLVSFMKEQGFLIYDICSIIRRPLDNALFQSDFLFLGREHALRSSTKWSSQ